MHLFIIFGNFFILIKLLNIGYTRSWNEKFDIDHRSAMTNLLLTKKIELSKFSFESESSKWCHDGLCSDVSS